MDLINHLSIANMQIMTKVVTYCEQDAVVVNWTHQQKRQSCTPQAGNPVNNKTKQKTEEMNEFVDVEGKRDKNVFTLCTSLESRLCPTPRQFT